MAKLNTRKKRSMSVDELRAYKVAYGGKLGAKDFITYVGVPAGLFGGLSFIILYNFWVTLACALLGAIYGVSFVLPRTLRKQYAQQAFVQRNKFLNNITQVLTDDGQTVLMAIHKVTTRSAGEFKEELKQYHAMLIGADNERIREATLWFAGKYDDDVIFVQYLEQLETAMLEGKTNIDTLKDIKSYHNDIRKKQDFYEVQKQQHLSAMKTLVIITVVLILSLAISFGFDTYIEAFARHWSGYIAATLYLGLLAVFFRQFTTYLFDDSVMEIRKK